VSVRAIHYKSRSWAVGVEEGRNGGREGGKEGGREGGRDGVEVGELVLERKGRHFRMALEGEGEGGREGGLVRTVLA